MSLLSLVSLSLYVPTRHPPSGESVPLRSPFIWWVCPFTSQPITPLLVSLSLYVPPSSGESVPLRPSLSGECVPSRTPVLWWVCPFTYPCHLVSLSLSYLTVFCPKTPFPPLDCWVEYTVQYSSPTSATVEILWDLLYVYCVCTVRKYRREKYANWID